IINRSGQNLLSIINDVLDISKIEAGKLTTERSPFSIDDILADLHGLFYERAREKSVSIGYHVDPSVPDALIGDATRLNQVITNLVNNALKFTEKGGVTIGVSSRQSEKGLLLEIKVTDTGIGIAADKLELVFERFTQADQSITRRFGGTGLGLAISRRLVEAMGGDISVKSREGFGSSFTFDVVVDAEENTRPTNILTGSRIKISMKDALQSEVLSESLRKFGARVTNEAADNSYVLLLSDDVGAVDQSSRTALFLESAIDVSDFGYKKRGRLIFSVPSTRSQIRQLADAIASQDFTSFRAGNLTINRAQNLAEFRGLRALAVDDNTVNREVIVEALSSMGIETETAVNGEDALSKAKAVDYDIIFMDCSMPVMDGYTATRILRDREKGGERRVPIVAITALSEHGNKQSWQDAGMDAWISKPFTIPAIAERVSKLVLKHTAAPLLSSTMNEDEQLIAKFEAIPLLDEQTVSMIARLGSAGHNPATLKILNLFVANASAALDQLTNVNDPKEAEPMVTIVRNLHSFSQSVGALRLAHMAAHFKDGLKSGRAVEPWLLAVVGETFDASRRELIGRFGLAPMEKRATA
ncbi:MAG: ATP-binding protein, partial [Rhizobiaceae bacterium]